MVTDKSFRISSTLNHRTQAAKTLTPLLCQGCNKEAPWIRCEAELCHTCNETWVKRSFGWDQSQNKNWYCAKCLVGLNWTVDIIEARRYLCSICAVVTSSSSTPSSLARNTDPWNHSSSASGFPRLFR